MRYASVAAGRGDGARGRKLWRAGVPSQPLGKHTRHIAKPHAEIARRLVFLCALCGQARLEQLFGRKDAGGSYLSLELTTL